MVSSHLKGAKKFKVWLNSSRNCSVCVRITFDEMESSFPRFNHVCFWFRRWIARAIGSPSSSCEMILLRNNSHGGIIRICMGIFTTAFRNKKIRQIFNKNTSPYFHSVSLVIWPLTWWKEPILASCSFRGFQRTWEKPFFLFLFSKSKSCWMTSKALERSIVTIATSSPLSRMRLQSSVNRNNAVSQL